MLTVTGNIVSNTAHPDRVSGRIAIGKGSAEPLFLSYTAFGPNAYSMKDLQKGDYVTLTGRLVTLPERTKNDGTVERNTILRAESSLMHGSDEARGGSGRGKSLHALFGRLGQAPQINHSVEGPRGHFSAANFSVAENVTYVDRNTGDVMERTHWHNIVAYGPPNDSPAAGLDTGSPVLVRGRIEADLYTSGKGVRVGALRTVADELVHPGRSSHFAEICGVIENVHRRGDPTIVTIRSERADGTRISIPLSIAAGPDIAGITAGRYLHAVGEVGAELSAPEQKMTLKAGARNVTLLDTMSAPGGSQAGYSTVHAVGVLAEKPVAKLTVSGGESLAIAETTLVSANGAGEPANLPVSIWRNAAEIASEYADKGTRIYGSGYLMAVSDEQEQAERNVAAINYVRIIGS